MGTPMQEAQVGEGCLMGRCINGNRSSPSPGVSEVKHFDIKPFDDLHHLQPS